MIKSFVLKNCLSFDEVSLDFDAGLSIFSGPSGAGKSVLMGGLLASFGLLDSPSSLCECVSSANLPEALLESGIENEDENIFRLVKKEKSKLLVNGQNISKKALSSAMQSMVIHLSSKDGDEFEGKNLLLRLDNFIASSELESLKSELASEFVRYETAKKELDHLLKQEREAEEQKDYLRFEIQKIEKIAPKIGEDDELLEIKKLISKKEKTEELLTKCQVVDGLRDKVSALFEQAGQSDEIAIEFFSQLEDVVASTVDRLRELDGHDVDSIMNRLEELSSIKKLYGSIEEALEALEAKRAELKLLQNIEIVKSELEKEVKKLLAICESKADAISKVRHANVDKFAEAISGFLQKLFLPAVKISFAKKALGGDGVDSLSIKVGNTEPSKLSAGEYRRARLALMCVGLGSDSTGKVMIVDEADANVSGEESAAIAKTLKLLSRSYQIFAISHQPQLSALADRHFLVTKIDKKSSVVEINDDKRAMEIARIVSGEKITAEAIGYAKKLLKESKC